MLEIAGFVVSTIGVVSDLVGKYVDLAKWDEQDIEVDNEWLKLAVKMNVISAPMDQYEWIAERRVPTAELKGTHSVVVAANEAKRVKYRIVRGRAGSAAGRNILVRKTG